jgi:hypothetical protein
MKKINEDENRQVHVHKRKPLILAVVSLVIFAGLVITGNKVSAQNNLLVNGNFNSPASTATPTGWTTWTVDNTAGAGYANHQTIPANNLTDTTDGGADAPNNTGNYDGSYQMSLGATASDGSGGGVYQIVAGLPNVPYTLIVDGGAQGWWWPTGEIRLFFLNSNNVALATNVVYTTDGITNYNIGVPYQPWTNSATSPAGTTQVKVEFAGYGGGTCWFDNASLTSTYDVPTISNVYPNGYTLLQYTNALTFTAASASTQINPGDIQLTLNGSNVSAGLVINGGPLSYSVSYSGLKSNQLCTASIMVTDTNGISTAASYSFDTYNPTLLWEAEDWDFTNGMYINNPALSSTNAPDSYFGVVGFPNVDDYQQDGSPPGNAVSGAPYLFRPGSSENPPMPISTSVAGDTPRTNFINAQLVNSNVQDYAVGYFDGSDWLNYTRNFPTGKYNIYGRLAAGTAGSIRMSMVTSGQGTSSQTTNYLGAFQMPVLGWGTYSYVPLTDVYGNLVSVSLGGVNTLKVNAANAGGNMNFFFAVPANTSTPIITNIYPSGLVLFQPTNAFTFQAVSPAGGYSISTNGIQLSLNGVNVTSNLVETGSSSSWSVSYSGLKSNTVYTAVINVTDVAGDANSSTLTFDTYNPGFVWEGEDWDYNGGQFINNPVLSSVSQANSYFGQIGTQGIDENTLDHGGNSLTSAGAQHLFRSSDTIATGLAEDTPRQNYLTAQAGNPNIQDYMLGWFNPGMWVNYSRVFPAGTYNIYVRAAYGNGGNSALYLSELTGVLGTNNQAAVPIVEGVTNIGTFTIPSDGWTTYSYVPCVDGFGNLAQVTFNGTTTNTFQLTAGSANVNFFMLVPATMDLPRIANVYPNGLTLLQATNTFAFTVLAATSPGIPISTNNISLTLNGSNAPLTFAASGQNWNATTPLSLNVTNYTAVINAMDNDSNTVTSTVYFDTFNPGNFTWQASDYDYNGGMFIDNPVPTSAPATNSYYNLSGDLGFDYYINTADLSGSAFYLYRTLDDIGTDICSDTPLQKYVTARLTNPAVYDYNVGWWLAGSWLNYTHTYPTGKFNIYGRLSGNAGTTYSNQLSQVIGANTNLLGYFTTVGSGYNIFNWVPLTVNGTNVIVSLGGVAKLEVTSDGNVNPNLFMLVPVTGLAVTVTVSISAGTVYLSYPTQNGHNYEIEYKTALTNPTWTPLANYAGDGTVQTHSVGAATGTMFYQVVTQ